MDKSGSGKGQGLKIGTKSFNPNAPVFIPSAYVQPPAAQSARKADKSKSFKSKKPPQKPNQQAPSSQAEPVSTTKPPQSQPSQDQTQPKTDVTPGTTESWLNTNAPEFIPRQYDPSIYYEGNKSGYQPPYYHYPYSYKYQQPILMTPPLPQHQYMRVPNNNERLDQFLYQQSYSTHQHSSGSTDIVNSPDKPSVPVSTPPPPPPQDELKVPQLNCTTNDKSINETIDETINEKEPIKEAEQVQVEAANVATNDKEVEQPPKEPEQQVKQAATNEKTSNEKASNEKASNEIAYNVEISEPINDISNEPDAKTTVTASLEKLSISAPTIPDDLKDSKELATEPEEDSALASKPDHVNIENQTKEDMEDPSNKFEIIKLISIGAALYSMNMLESPFKFTDAKTSSNEKETKKHKDEVRQSSRHDYHESKKLSGFFSCDRYNEIDFVRPVQEHLPEPSETSWVAKQKSQKSDDTIALVRKVKGLLNRLTYEKFDIIYTQLIQIGVFTMEHLRLLIDVVFEKAVTQHHFISMYGELCSKIKKDIVIEGGEAVDDSEKNNIVRRLLLDKCQNSFESNLKPMVLPPDLSEEESFEAEQKYKHRMRGNMMFVGELLKRKILAAKVLIACLDQVMLKRAECIADGDIDRGNNHLEAMCTLLQTVGKSFDTSKWKHLPDLDKHLESLKVIGQDERISFRIRCIIKNVLDSRNDKWEDRGAAKITEIPCKLEEFRSRVQAESERTDRSRNRDLNRFNNNNNKNNKFDRIRINKNDRDEDIRNTEIEFNMPKDVLKRRLNGIISELAFSGDTNEANECIAELKIPDNKLKMMLLVLYVCIVENCAKVTMHKERKIVLSWFITIARNQLQHSIDDFLTGREDEHYNYFYMLEDYPVLPTIMEELFTLVKDSNAVSENVIAKWRDSIGGNPS